MKTLTPGPVEEEEESQYMPQKAISVALPQARKTGIPALSERAPTAWSGPCLASASPGARGAPGAVSRTEAGSPGLLASAQVSGCCGPRRPSAGLGGAGTGRAGSHVLQPPSFV